MSIGLVTKTITAQNTFSDAIAMQKGGFSFTLSGINGDTVHLQRSVDNGVSWIDVAYYTENGWYPGNEPQDGTVWRFGVKTGGYGAGTIVGTISY